jgi:hypothetical protein
MNRLMVSIVMLVGFMLIPTIAPQTASAAVASGCSQSSFFLGMPTWYEYLDIGPKNGDPCAIVGPVDTNGNLDWSLAGGRIALAIVDILLRLAGIIAVAFTIYGGVQYVMSEGDPEKAKKGRESVFNALIGLVVVLISTAAVNFIGGTLIK